MVNSSWFAVTNEVLRLALLPVIPDVDTFDSDSDLQEFQSGAKWYVRLCHSFMTLRMVKHFATRRIQLPIDEDNHTYTLDLGINPSGIKFGSFRNVTAGGVSNGPLKAMTYEEFLDRHPDPSLLADNPQAPTHWILLPLERTEDPTNDDTVQTSAPVQRVRIYPNPDQNYTLEYRAQVLPYQLTSGKDVIMWPREYEHCLWLWAWAQTERALGEGKEGNIQSLAQKATSDVNLIAGVPDELRKSVRTIGSMRGAGWPPGRYSGWVSSPLG